MNASQSNPVSDSNQTARVVTVRSLAMKSKEAGKCCRRRALMAVPFTTISSDRLSLYTDREIRLEQGGPLRSSYAFQSCGSRHRGPRLISAVLVASAAFAFGCATPEPAGGANLQEHSGDFWGRNPGPHALAAADATVRFPEPGSYLVATRQPVRTVGSVTEEM
jgi:hypothetical protein